MEGDLGLTEILEEARRRGLVGPGPLEGQIAHALRFGDVIGDFGLRLALDLGSGGGLPGLVLAFSHPSSRWVLLDSRRRSGAFLREAVDRLGLGERVSVHLARAEDAGRDAAHRGRYGLVVARGFGPPAVTAECAAPLLEPGGRLVVSEPPDAGPDRWPADGLAVLGLRVSNTRGFDQAHFVVLEQVEPCPARFPRRSGVPGKRPLFHVKRQPHT